MVHFLYFGRLEDVAQTSNESIPLPADVHDSVQLRSWLDARFDAEKTFQDSSVRLVLDQSVTNEPCDVRTAKEIAFLPPVGGG